MLTCGVDLAAQPAGTAACLLAWEDGGAHVVELRLGLDDDALLEVLAGSAERVAIDAPFGWPDAFREAVAAHGEGRPWPGRELGQDAYRRTLRCRLTDEHTAAVRWPLSVSSDRIAVTTMRLAYLFDRLAAQGQPVDRAGGGRLCEVYPAASLVRFGLSPRGARRPAGAGVRATLLTALRQSLRLDLDGADSVLTASDHAFDALVAALAARAVALGRSHGPPPGREAQAGREGWIHLPCAGSLAGLRYTQPIGCVCSTADTT